MKCPLSVRVFGLYEVQKSNVIYEESALAWPKAKHKDIFPLAWDIVDLPHRYAKIIKEEVEMMVRTIMIYLITLSCTLTYESLI